MRSSHFQNQFKAALLICIVTTYAGRSLGQAPQVNPTQPPPREMGVPLPANSAVGAVAPSNSQEPTNDDPEDPSAESAMPVNSAPFGVIRPFNFDNPTSPYDPSQKRDIFYFKSLTDLYRKVEVAPVATSPGGPTVPLVLSENPLLNADLSAFEVLGILWEVDKPRAIIKDPRGQIHTIYNGTKIGIKGGAVAAIREGEVVVVEYWEEDDKVIKKPRMMVIKDRVR